jgi:antirestriction protein ArdC
VSDPVGVVTTTGRHGSAAYAMEELRAELSSVFLAGELGIPANIPNHASYINGWLKPLKDDKREIFRAAADAQRIVDMLMGFHPEFAARYPAQPDRPYPRLEQNQSNTTALTTF